MVFTIILQQNLIQDSLFMEDSPEKAILKHICGHWNLVIYLNNNNNMPLIKFY